MPPDPDIGETEQGDDQQQSTGPTFADLVKAGAGALASQTKFTESQQFRDLVNKPSDLEEPDVVEYLDAIKGTGTYGEKLVADLQQHLVADQEERKRADDEKAKSSVAAMADKIRKDKADEKAKKDAEEREERIRQEALALIAREEAGGDEPDPIGQEIAGFLAGLRDVRKTPGGPGWEERYHQVMEFIAPAEELAAAMSDPSGNPAAKVDRWNSTDEHTREVARRVLGVVPVFDIDVDSTEYQKDIEAARNEQTRRTT